MRHVRAPLFVSILLLTSCGLSGSVIPVDTLLDSTGVPT
ncbi:MAG: hypothetical protein RLY87_1925, partial [Chloroflexota bacterium]